MPGGSVQHHDHASEGLYPSGNGFGREQVSDIQRVRLLAAMIEVAVERGAGNVSVANVVARSGMSRRTFYEIFEDREDCFLAAFEDALARLAGEVVPAYEGARGWRAKVRAALTALLEFLEYEPDPGRLLIVESLAAGPGALERRAWVLAQVVSVVDQGRHESKTGLRAPPLAAEGVVGGVLAVLHARLTARDPRQLNSGLRTVELVNQLMGMIVLPYLGASAVRRELERPVPKPPLSEKIARSDPLRELDMRLTYRTIRVLRAVAAHPGSSNRTVGEGAGITDQGQISKLLARLHGIGLVDNNGTGPTRGEPNAWTLTTQGWEVHGAITQQRPSR